MPHPTCADGAELGITTTDSINTYADVLPTDSPLSDRLAPRITPDRRVYFACFGGSG
jgi:hypothetical protein